MSLGYIENQPVIFVPVGTNPEDLDGRGHLDFTIPVEYNGTDKTYVQLQIAPNAGSPNLVDPPLATATTSWGVTGSGTLAVGLITIGNGSTGSATYGGMDGTMVNGLNYQIQITISVMFGTVKVYNGWTLLAEIQSSGTYTISFVAGDDSIGLAIEDSTSYVEFTNVSVWNLPENYALGILDSNFVPTYVITFQDDPTYFTLSKNTLTIMVDWAELGIPIGCWYLGMTDPETNTCQQFGLYNWDFNIDNNDELKTSIQGWTGTHATQVLFDSFKATITSLNTEIQSILSDVNNELCEGLAYKVTVNAAKGDATNVTLRVNSGGSSDSVNITSSSNVDYILFITPAFADYLRVQNDNNTVPYGATNILIVNSVKLELVSLSDWDFEAITQDAFQVQVLPDDQTKVIGIFNNEDGLGFCFEGSGFFPQLRCESKFINRKYTSEREDEENDIGFRSITFGERRKSRIFRIENQPNYIHDFLSLAIIADHFYTDETEYFVASDKYDPQYEEALDNFAPVELELSNPTQLVRNINSGTIQGPPANDGGEMITPRGIERIVEPATGDILEAK